MHIKLSWLGLVFYATSFVGSTYAAPTALKVKGTIQPLACAPQLAGSGQADFGVIQVTSLNPAIATRIGQRSVAFNIQCESPVKIALAGSDNRAASVLGGAPIGAFGLGTAQGKKIGYYTLQVQSIAADGASAQPLAYSGGTSVAIDGNLVSQTPARWDIGDGNIGHGRVAFSRSGSQPGAYKALSGMLTISATIDRANNLPRGADILLDGSATIEMQYL